MVLFDNLVDLLVFLKGGNAAGSISINPVTALRQPK